MFKNDKKAPCFEAKRHIDTLFELRGKNDPNSTTLANTLDKDIQTVFNTSEKFVYELLQNADDAAIGDQPIDVNFIVKENDLYFFHNGKHFDFEDVEAICDNAQRKKQGKKIDIEKTGYKGIGFKSVFVITDCVHIISNNYSFRFDSNYSQWQETSSDHQGYRYPWQIVPISTPIESAQPHITLDKNQVNFILKNLKDQEIQKAFATILKNPKIILFLRRIRSITININNKSHVIQLERKANERILFFNNQEVSRWLVFKQSIIIDEMTHQKLQLLGEHECPIKLKQAERTTITFAVEIRHNEINPQRTSKLFSYLPTEVKCDLPFLVNADFLLTADRMQLLNNIWNEFLFTKIGAMHVMWLNIIALSEDLYGEVLKILTPTISSDYIAPNFSSSYQFGASRQLNKIPFIPSNRDRKKLLKIDEVKFDDTQFYNAFRDIDPDLETSLALYSLSSTAKIPLHITWPDLTRKLSHYLDHHNTLDFNIKLITFLMENIPDKIEHNWIEDSRNYHLYLDRIPFILSAENNMVAPKDIYITADSTISIPSCIQIKTIHPLLLENQKIRAWFIHIGIREVKRYFILNEITSLIPHEVPITEADSLEIISFFYESWCQNPNFLHSKERSRLTKLPLLTQNNLLKPANECYFNTSLEPTFDLESRITDKSFFISSKYLENNQGIITLQKIFSYIGVRDNITIHLESQIDLLHARSNDKIDYFDDYFSFIKEHDKVTGWGGQSKYITNFVFVDFMRFLPDPYYAKQFWEFILSDYEKILTKFKNSKFQSRSIQYNYSYDITPYIVYFCSERPSIRGRDGKLYRTKDLHKSTLLDELGPKLSILFPRMDTFDGAINLNTDVEDFFRFKSELSPQDYIKIFTTIETLPLEEQIEYYSNLFQVMAKQKLSPTTLSELQSSNPKVLAADNTLKPAKTLCFYPAETSLRQIKLGDFLKELPRVDIKDLITACRHLNINLLSNATLAINTSTQINDSQLKDHYIHLIQYWSLIEEKITKQRIETIYKSWLDKLDPLEFVSVSELTITWETNNLVAFQPSIFLHQNRLYYLDNSDSLRSVFQEVSKLLKVHDKTIIEILNMLHDQRSHQEWLEANNYNLIQLNRLNENNTDKEASTPVSVQKENQSHYPMIDDHHFHSDEAIPQTRPSCKPSTIDYSHVNFETRTFQYQTDTDNLVPRSTTNQITETSLNVRKQEHHAPRISHAVTMPADTKPAQPAQSWTGTWGEEAVYLKLKSHYRHKYPTFAFFETNNTFVLEGINRTGKNTKLEVIFLNKEIESGQPYDLEIIKNGKHRYLEVKSTHDSHKCLARFSKNEWQMMHKIGKCYQIFCVFNAGQNNASITKIKNPAKLIQDGELQPHEVQFKLVNT